MICKQIKKGEVMNTKPDDKPMSPFASMLFDALKAPTVYEQIVNLRELEKKHEHDI